MKKVILNEAQIKALVREMLCSTGSVNEISSADAYDRFYSKQVPREKFEELMAGAPTMTPLHKRALDLMTGPKNEWGTKGVWSDDLAQLVAKVWNSGNENMKKYAIDQLRDFESIETMTSYLRRLYGFKNHTEAGYADSGYVVLADTPQYLITCTTSYAASRKHFGDSHWCTASDVGGRYNGFKMFAQYTGIDGDDECALLIQLTDKEQRAGSIQVQLYEDGDTGDICKFNGSGLHRDSEMVRPLLDAIRTAVANAGGFAKLWKETQDNVDEEEEYWNKKYYDLLDKKKKKFMDNDKAYEGPILEMMSNSPGWGQDYGGVPKFKYRSVAYKNGEWWQNPSVAVYNVGLYGFTKDEYDWILEAQEQENYEVANGFNNQVWVVDKKSNKIINKIKGGYIYQAINNVGIFTYGDIEMEDSYGYDSLVDLQTGNILVKKFKEVKTMWLRDIPYEVDGHRVLLFFEEAKEKPTEKEKYNLGVMQKWYTSGIDTVTGKYLGHIKIDWMKKEDVYGNGAIINI